MPQPFTVPLPAVAPPELPGMRCTGLIGTGASAFVYRYRRRGPSSADVAVKVARQPLPPAARQRFLRAAAILPALSHDPHLLTLHRMTLLADSRSLIIMDYAAGGSLQERMAQPTPLSPACTVQIGMTMAQALAVAHRHGVIHRDVKPANIVFLADGAPVLADFGVSGSPYDVRGAGFTPRWAAPEVLRGIPGNEQADLYALAATMRAMLRSHMPEALEPVLRRAMAEDPDDRYPAAADLLEDLRRVMHRIEAPRSSLQSSLPSQLKLSRQTHQTDQAEQTSQTEQTRPERPQHSRQARRSQQMRRVAGTVAMLMLVLAGGSGIVLMADVVTDDAPTVVGPAFTSDF